MPAPAPSVSHAPAADTRDWTVAKAPGAVPLLGHTLALWKDPLGFLASLPAHGDLVELRLGPKRAYLACHPDLVRHILLSPRTYDKGGVFDKARQLLGNSLSVSRGEEHRRQRRLIQPAFQPARLAAYTNSVAADTARTIESWEPGQVLDVSDAMHVLLMRVAARTLFSAGLDDATTDEARECLRTVSQGIYKRTVAPVGVMEKLPTPGNRRYDESNRRLREIVDEMIKARRGHEGGDEDLLSILLNVEHPQTGERLSEAQILDQVVTFLVAGSETTASTLAFVFHLLGRHPEAERRMQDEIDRVLDGRPALFDDLPDLPYTKGVITEALRLYPPSWLSMRVAAQDVEIGGHRIAEGTMIMYSSYALHHNAELFPDPERFDPERWLPPRLAEVPRGALVPFGHGAHKCIGDVLALAETTLIVSTIANGWRLRPVPGTELRPQPKATLEPGPLPMRCEPRRRTTKDTDG
ncbi:MULTISPECIES: cytochrome P450 [unclassified Streptomyces]|uniref:cytochrome P450 n=1 Tax=unclassified Streptomyces TaxID=2593676 RepID=UPI000DC7E482|nr:MULTISPECIES: cytochrome P450 [unclassified Streptomyces]AWZ03667.1 cytochrome P450 [Streptomyces sp. ICC4]AWZ11186.1 cytochrome P450 [Streptomyces sp. ICC1]